MASRRKRASTQRKTQFERLEPRQVMSAQPLGDFQLEYFAEGEAEVGAIADSFAAGDLNQLLNNAHDQTGLTNVRSVYGFTGSGQTVAVIDSGIAYDHYALGGGLGAGYQVVGGWDFSTENDADPYDDGFAGSHGTHVAGIATGDGIGATSLAADGIGVAPGALLYAAKVLAANGSGTDAQVIEGIDWCASLPNVDILSMSLGDAPTDGNDPMSVAVNCVADPNFTSPITGTSLCGATSSPKIIVISAGNSGAMSSTVGTPGTAANAITVGAAAEWSGNPADLWQDDGLYLNSFSSRGPVVDGTGAFVRIKPDITGPGSRVHSAFIANPSIGYYGSAPNIYATLSGTSMSTPFVSGVIALMLEADPDLGVDDTATGGLLPF